MGVNREQIMSNASKKYYLKLNFDNKTYHVKMKSFNSGVFANDLELYVAYELFFQDLVDFANEKKEKVRVIEFLKDSVKNNHMLNDSLMKNKFNVQDNHIYTVVNNEELDLVNTGEFTIDNYKVNTCGSHMFFTDLTTNEQFMYYGD